MLFVLILGHFGYSVVTYVTVSSNLENNFKKISKTSKDDFKKKRKFLKKKNNVRLKKKKKKDLKKIILLVLPF